MLLLSSIYHTRSDLPICHTYNCLWSDSDENVESRTYNYMEKGSQHKILKYFKAKSLFQLFFRTTLGSNGLGSRYDLERLDISENCYTIDRFQNGVNSPLNTP